MSEGDTISRLLDALQAGDAAAAAALCAQFQEQARAVARRRVSPLIQARVGVSDVVQEALHSAFRLVRRGGLRHNRREEFEAILLTLIQRKAATAARKATAEQELPADALPFLADKRPTPDQEAMQNESDALARQAVWEMTEFLFQRREAMKSKHHTVRSLVRVLGIVHALGAKEIVQVLREQFPDDEPPKERTIQLAIEDGWELLRKEFRNEGRSGE